MNVLVIGGTSFFGKAIVEHLIEAGHNVSVFSRGNQNPHVLSKVTHITGDRKDKTDLSAKVGGQTYDVVIDNIAYNAEDVENALGVLKGKVGRYILTSTGSLYFTGKLRMPVVEEDVDYNFAPPETDKDSPMWTYTMGKLNAESRLINQDSQEFTIIRPPIVLGPDDITLRGYFYLQRLMDKKPIVVTNGGVQSFRLVYSEDLAKAYLLAMNSELAIGKTYNIVQQEVITLKLLLNEAAKALDVEPTLVDVPHDAMKSAGFEYPEPYAPMQNFMMDISKAERDLGYASTPFSEWIGNTARWYRDSYTGKDSANYENREREVAFADQFNEAISGINISG